MPPCLKLATGFLGLGLFLAWERAGVRARDQSAADADQIPGNIAIVNQTGSANTASAEQQAILGAAYANAAQIQQNGSGGSAKSCSKVAEFRTHRPICRRQQGEHGAKRHRAWRADLPIQQRRLDRRDPVRAGVPGAPLIIKQYRGSKGCHMRTG